jgi:DNA polymerase I-like protein with 3'-5' exonuclease and polymerase domains
VHMNLNDFNNYDVVKSVIVRTEDQFQDMLTWIAARTIIGLDYETNGVNPRKDKNIGIGIGDIYGGYYLPLYEWNGQELIPVWPPNAALKMLKALEGKFIVAFNGNFEVGFSEQLGWDLLPHFQADPMLMLHTLNENLFNYGLKENGDREFGPWTNIAMEEMLASVQENGGSDKEYYRANTNKLGHYCVWDNAIAVAMYLKYDPQLKKENLDKFYYEDEVLPTYKYVVGPMERNGIKVDIALLQDCSSKLKLQLSNIETQIHKQIDPLLADFKKWYLDKEYPPKRTGPFAQAVVDFLAPDSLPRTPGGGYSLTAKNIGGLPEGLLKDWLTEKCLLPEDIVLKVQQMMQNDIPMFNIASTDHLGRLFFGKLNEEALSYTPKKGAPQINEPFLDLMSKKYTWAADLLVFRRLSKLDGTYYQRIIDKLENGRFYPSYFSHRTTSGRQSGDFQQLPRPLSIEDEPNETIRYFTNQIRALFIADSGYKFLDADYNSLEVVVFADDAGDEALLEMIRNDYDFYSTVAIGAYNLNEFSADKKADNFLKKHKPEIRQATKAFALGFRYGEDPFKLHKETGWTKEECDRIHKAYFEAYPKLRKRMEDSANQMQTYGSIRSKFGRKRREPKAMWMRQKYGADLLDSLALWKKYHSEPVVYEKMKAERRVMKSILNNAYNFPIQSAAASIVSRAALALAHFLSKYVPKARIIALIHDQVVVHCPEEDLEFAKKNMKRIMENTTKLSVPLIADPAVASNLRDGH